MEKSGIAETPILLSRLPEALAAQLERAARMAAESEARFRALLIEKLKYTIAKFRHDKSKRGAILEQLELSLADLERGCVGGRDSEADGSGIGEDRSAQLRAAQANAPAFARASAARANRMSGTGELSVLRQRVAQDRQRHD